MRGSERVWVAYTFSSGTAGQREHVLHVRKVRNMVYNDKPLHPPNKKGAAGGEIEEKRRKSKKV